MVDGMTVYRFYRLFNGSGQSTLNMNGNKKKILFFFNKEMKSLGNCGTEIISHYK